MTKIMVSYDDNSYELYTLDELSQGIQLSRSFRRVKSLKAINDVEVKKDELKSYLIHHAIGSGRFQEIDVQPREYAGIVMASSLEDAYKKSQNGDKPWNTTHPCRSTSVGDTIQDEQGYHLVCGMGFRLLKVEDEER